ncbi:zinc finger BED domain-containing protein 4-like [Nothobranchius furzeri]|uniref:zinc finger BED domain-containing protein 4-like n=1 Tax=Nothobranchius furzeri TaxID=105023 RepID=UPI00390471FD
MSTVWKYFTLEAPQSKTATCNVCKAVVPRGGTSVATFNTTNLIKHLKKHHPREHEEFLTRGQKGEKRHQESLLESLKKQSKLPADNVKAMGITEKLLNFIVLDDQPLSVVENEGFRSLNEHLEPRYSLPSRTYLSGTALPELYNRVSAKLAGKLKGVPALSFTADIWTSDVCPMSLISLTVHWVDSGTHHVCCAVLQVKKCRGSHNRATIAAAIAKMLNNRGIPLEKVHVILRDNASNVKAALEDMAVPNLGCFAHTLQLVVHEGLMSQRSVSDALANSRKIVAHFKHSQLAQSRLEDLQREMQGTGTTSTPARLIQDVQTRWNSSFYMVKRLLTEKRALCAYAADHNLPATLSANEWGLLEKTDRAGTVRGVDEENQLSDLHCSRRYPSRHRFKTSTSRGEQYRQRHQNNEEHTPPSCQQAIQQHRKFFTGGEATRTAKDLLKQELEEMEQALAKASAGKAGTRKPEPEPAEKVAHVDASSPPTTSKSSFSSLYDKILEEHDEPAQGTQAAVIQMQMYLKEPTMGDLDSPFQYWADNHAHFPLLAAVAVKFLSGPSTSVESGSLFSTASNIVAEKRNRLTAERAQMLNAYIPQKEPVIV